MRYTSKRLVTIEAYLIGLILWDIVSLSPYGVTGPTLMPYVTYQGKTQKPTINLKKKKKKTILDG